MGCFYSEAADKVAGEAADLFGRCGSDVLSDEKQLQVAYTVARRLAIIEATIWRQFGQVEHKEPTLKKLQVSQAAAVKRKLDDAIENTTGEEGCHSTFQLNGWIRCRDCPSFSRPGNKGYWSKKLCQRRFKRLRTQSVVGGAL